MYGTRIQGIAMILAIIAAPTFGQEQSQFVPRSEYEQLKKDFEALRQQVNTDRASQQEYYRYVQQELEKAQAGRENDQPVELMLTSTMTPGYERMRRPGWMDTQTGKVDDMNVRIGRAGDMDLYLGVDTVGRIFYFEQDNVEQDGERVEGLDPNFDTAFGNFSFLADFDGALEVYFDIFIASRPHPDQLQGNEGYMLVRELPAHLKGQSEIADWFFEQFDIKAGEFEIDFGDAHFRRSTNAKVQRNPLIGNYVIDPRATDISMELISTPEPVKWMVGIGSGGDTGDFSDDHGFSARAKVWGDVLEDLRASASIYHVDHSGNPANVSREQLFRSNRSGGPYAAVFGDGSAPGQITPGAGQQVTAAQVDLTWTPTEALEVYGHFGWMQDSDLNGDTAGTPREAWYYYAAEAMYRINERLYLAARYSGASAIRVNDTSSDGLVHRIQVGGGYWIFDTVLAKLEYVYQKFDDFSESGGQIEGEDVWLNPEFQGLAAEISFAF